MTNIIVAFPKQDNARNIKKILMQNGHHVDAVCSTGAQVLQSAGELGGGIVVCGYRFVDMMYTELHEYLPVQFEMLLVASPANCGNRDVENLVCLATPLKVNELLDTVEMMEYTITRRRKKLKQIPKERTKEEQELMKHLALSQVPGSWNLMMNLTVCHTRSVQWKWMHWKSVRSGWKRYF